MGRPSLKEQRSEEILQAFEACVARFGVEGSTLEKIAEQAGLARALIRHNIGNRDLLIERLVERTMAKAHDSMGMLLELLPEDQPADHLLEYLFEPEFADHQLNLVLWALITAGNEDHKIAEQMRVWVSGFIGEVKTLLSHQFPSAKASHVAAVATGITGIYFNVDTLVPLGDIAEIRQDSKQAASILLDALRS